MLLRGTRAAIEAEGAGAEAEERGCASDGNHLHEPRAAERNGDRVTSSTGFTPRSHLDLTSQTSD